MKKKNLLMTVIAIFGLATITFGQTVPSYIPTSGLVGWWPFNGNANDESGNGNNGTVYGAVLTSDRFSNVNKAYNFDGSTNYIEVPSTSGVSFSTAYSISAWLSADIWSFPAPIDQHAIVSKIDDGDWYGGYEIRTGGAGFIMHSGNIGSNFDIGAGGYSAMTWHHVVVTFNGSIVKSYIDGQQVDSAIRSVTIQTSSIPLRFGRRGGAGTYNNWFDGNIDDIGMWNRALTQAEISALFNGCSGTAVTTQPINQSVNISNNAQFTTASSDPLATYQWQTDLGVGFQNLNSVGQYSGTTNDTLTIANTTLSNNNQPFRCIVSSGSCTDTSNVAVLTVNNNVGINEFTQDNLFSVFPNPAQSVINVKADNNLIGEVYSIYDNTGRVVLTGKLNAQNTTIELGNLSGGIYMFSVGENMKQIFKIIKE
jgi:hypothetical protein